jgi:hypothetical protein
MPDVPESIPTPGSSSSMTVTSADQFDGSADFTDHVVSSLHRNREYHEYIFTDVPRWFAEAVYQLVDEYIPSR